jgi:hypothetical protein
MTYNDYHEWLFPGDPIQNPLDLAPDADADCQTGISVDWLARSAREVFEGLAGLGCLYFLHGAAGEINRPKDPPTWFGEIVDFIQQKVLDDPEEARRKLRDIYVAEINWAKGSIVIEKFYDARKAVKQNFKIGRFIDEFAEHMGWDSRQRQSMHHDLKWRAKADIFDWWISCDTLDVLTMSHGRPWPSCMKPGGLFEYGPLTDMAAGSAVLWFKPKGSDVASGRLILRPFLDPAPSIASGGRLYGTGPDISPKTLNTLLNPWLQGLTIKLTKLCPKGQTSKALTRAIYSDTDGLSDGCSQSMEQYDRAYQKLGAAAWPEPNEDLRLEAAAEAAQHAQWREGTEEEDDTAEEEIAEANRTLLEEGEANIEDWWLEPGPSNMENYELLMNQQEQLSVVREYIQNTLENDAGQGDYFAFYEYDVEYDESIEADIVSALKKALAKSLLDAASYGEAVLTFPTDSSAARAKLLIPSIFVEQFSPREIWDKWARLFEHHGEMSWDDAGRAIDDGSGKEVKTVLIVKDLVLDDLPNIATEALHVERAVDTEEMQHADEWLREIALYG